MYRPRSDSAAKIERIWSCDVYACFEKCMAVKMYKFDKVILHSVYFMFIYQCLNFESPISPMTKKCKSGEKNAKVAKEN
jgi:hypothetical protein